MHCVFLSAFVLSCDEYIHTYTYFSLVWIFQLIVIVMHIVTYAHSQSYD